MVAVAANITLIAVGVLAFFTGTLVSGSVSWLLATLATTAHRALIAFAALLARAVWLTLNALVTIAVLAHAAFITMRTFFTEASLVVAIFTIAFSALSTLATAGASFTGTSAGFYAIFALAFCTAFITFAAVFTLNTIAGSSRSGFIAATADSTLFTLVAVVTFYTVTLGTGGVVGVNRFLAALAMRIASLTVIISRFVTSGVETTFAMRGAFFTVAANRGA